MMRDQEDNWQAILAMQQAAEAEISLADDLAVLEKYRVKYLGKKSKLTEYLTVLGTLESDARRIAGQQLNLVKTHIQEAILKRKAVLEQEQITQELLTGSVDVTLTGRRLPVGSLHPLTLTMMTVRHLFMQLGFVCLEGPEQEDDYHNFAALNIPLYHPARTMQDTFYFHDGSLLRTHLSSVEVRAMREQSLPFRMIAMGRVYRRDFDLTHTPMFHQMEGLIIDEHLSFRELKSILHYFLLAFFDRERMIRFRPSYFPFTEPSAEVDISCLACHGKGCRLCKQTGWIEVLGCGMIHPNVFKAAKIDSERYRGLAWGVGLDRLTLLKYAIPDLRLLFENDLQFLSQF